MAVSATRELRLFADVRWGRLAKGFFLTAVLSLSVHVVMTDILHVPYPDQTVKAWLPFRLATDFAMAWGAIWLYGCIHTALQQRSRALSAIILFLLMCGLNETLRGWFMNAYCGVPHLASAAFLALTGLAGALSYATTVALAALGWRYMETGWQKAAGILILGLLLTFAINPLVSLAQQGIAAHFQYLAPTHGWCEMPYGLNVQIPSYATFVEPALACLFCAAFSWRYLPGGLWTKTLVFTLLILALKQQLFAAFIYAFYAKLPFWTALSSMGQFSLEAAALGLLTALSGRGRRVSSEQ